MIVSLSYALIVLLLGSTVWYAMYYLTEDKIAACIGIGLIISACLLYVLLT